MQLPPSRNHLASSVTLMDSNWTNVDYCPFCLNLGSVGAVSGGGQFKWPAGNRAGSTVCGDPPTGTPQYLIGATTPFRRYNYLWSRSRTFGAAYLRGASFPVSLRFTTYHRGAVQLQLCVISNWTAAREQQLLTNACFEQGVLRQASVNASQPNSPWWYLPNRGVNNTLYSEGWQGTLSTRFQLPANVTCNFFTDKSKCVRATVSYALYTTSYAQVIRMYYRTGNTCNAPNVPAAYANTTSPFLPTCGSPTASYPEEFRYVLLRLVIHISWHSSPATAQTSSSSSRCPPRLPAARST